VNRQRCGCREPEEIFEYADRQPGDAAHFRAHLAACPRCRELYERELRLSEQLRSVEFHEARSVSREVAMALPTRPTGARFLWAALAGALFVVALFAFDLRGGSPVTLLADATGWLWGISGGLWSVASTMFAAAGSIILAAFILGALADLAIAAALLRRSRRTREV
jgi:uncharacterized integral membrane protein